MRLGPLTRPPRAVTALLLLVCLASRAQARVLHEESAECPRPSNDTQWQFKEQCMLLNTTIYSPPPPPPPPPSPPPQVSASAGPSTDGSLVAGQPPPQPANASDSLQKPKKNPFVNPDVPLLVRSAQGASISGGRLGFRTGGAQDVENFRQNINSSYLPLPTDITFEGIAKDYFFDTSSNTTQPCTELFCPLYSLGVSPDPLVGQTVAPAHKAAPVANNVTIEAPDVYMAVGLDSGLSVADFKRKKLNLVILLDVSGSMSSTFDAYYYDQFGKQANLTGQEALARKMDVAKEVLGGMLGKLAPGDHVSVVLFSDSACTPLGLTPVSCLDLPRLADQIQKDVNDTSSTNLEAGLEDAMRQFTSCAACLSANLNDTENRLILITDAEPNMGDFSTEGLLARFKSLSDKNVFTTFIGVGLDFGTELIEGISKVKGANYFSVHTPGEFQKRLADDFDYAVTPLVFDLQLKVDPASVAGNESWKVLHVYGSPNPNDTALTDNGTLIQVHTLFPSPKTEAGIKGGVVLLRLKPPSDVSEPLQLQVTYTDRAGVQHVSKRTVGIQQSVRSALQPGMGGSGDLAFYQSTGVRKAVLLARYTDLVRNWLLDEWSAINATANSTILIPAELCGPFPDLFCPSRPFQVEPLYQGCTLEQWLLPGECILPVPAPVLVPLLGRWERQSQNLTSSASAKQAIREFLPYLESEMRALGDTSLQQEVDTLNKILAAPERG